MTYDIKTFQEDYIEPQAELGLRITDDWPGYGQSNAEALEQAYSGEDFDPSTRFYAFDDGKLVGFLTSNITKNEEGEKVADMRLPICENGHSDAAHPLLEHALETLEEREISRVTTIVKDDWDNLPTLAKEYGFEYESDGNMFAQQPLDSIKVPDSDPSIEIKEVNTEEDKDPIIRIFMEEFDMDEEQAQQNLQAIDGLNENQLITHAIIYKEDEVVGRAFAYMPTPEDKIAYTGNIYVDAENEDKYFNALLRHVYDECQSANAEKIMKFVMGDESMKEKYTHYGFKFDHVVKNYVKEFE